MGKVTHILVISVTKKGDTYKFVSSPAAVTLARLREGRSPEGRRSYVTIFCRRLLSRTGVFFEARSGMEYKERLER